MAASPTQPGSGKTGSVKPGSLKPWYRQFWPWFLIVLPTTAVVASLTTVYIAFSGADTLVRDNYYKDGLAINMELDQDRLAATLGLSADVNFDKLTGEVVVDLHGSEQLSAPEQLPASLQLQLIHPLDESRDMTLALSALGQGRYRGDLEALPQNRYYLRLKAAGEGLKPWRLNGEVDLDNSSAVLLIPNA